MDDLGSNTFESLNRSASDGLTLSSNLTVLQLQVKQGSFHDSPHAPQDQPKAALKKVAIRRLMLGFRLHEELHMCDNGKNMPNSGNLELVVVFGGFRFLDV